MLDHSLPPPSHVLQLARELRRQAIERRAALDGARRTAWQLYCHYNRRTVGCHPFWRCGFAHVLGRLANTGRDYTAVRAYDVIASSVAQEFPEWAEQADALWAWLAEPYERLPTTAQFLREAESILDRSTTETREFDHAQ